ncbi:ATP-dependent helicase [Desulfovibrio sp. OttesenSCG-928-I05]|nr:ATP-dependent helicase [Desulfovibrio sp. OttesenSCG-928-I05]
MIDYAKELNPAQLEAATTLDGPVLVIAGAGSGKTRTIVFRLANLVESGVPASSILLLTFTRKASREMVERAVFLLGQSGMGDIAQGPGLAAVQGGTFHAYAYSVLRLFRPEGFSRDASIMDSADTIAALQHCKENLKLGKGDSSFPKLQTVQSYISKSRNREQDLDLILQREAQHLLPHAGDMLLLADAYAAFKKEQGVLDYDDLLFTLEDTLRSRPEALAWCRGRHSHIMVDEYQDTNLVQARLAALLAGVDKDVTGGHDRSAVGNIMAVGDDAQSIYAFRGATVRNILRFPEIFPGTKIIRLEENYRSTQPVLDLTNAILENAPEGYAKHLFTRKEGGEKPRVIRPVSDLSQANIVAGRIVELLQDYPPHEIAVLFRAGFQSYHLEVQLNKLGIRFRKYGGIRYSEAAHVKDLMSYLRLMLNPLDFTAFQRIALLSRGVGPKTVLKLYQAVQTGDSKALDKARAKYPSLAEDLAFLDYLRGHEFSPSMAFSETLRHYTPRLEEQFPDDYPRRLQGLEQLGQVAAMYSDMDLFVTDLSLEDPLGNDEERDTVVLSTIHSAKGLEWKAVIVLDLVEDRFPSRHAMVRPDDFEEERRLMYVACTRAGESLDLSAPATLYDRSAGGTTPATPSPFIREIAPGLYDEWQESFSGGLVPRKRPGDTVPGAAYSSLGIPAAAAAPVRPAPRRIPGAPRGAVQDVDPAIGWQLPPDPASTQAIPSSQPPAKLGYCSHRIFGRGKIVQHLPPDKYKVNFPGMGLKVIMAAYLTMED